MQVSFDSNTWEKVFDPVDRDWAPVRSAISNGRMTGFICEAAFRIEAIRKRERAAYFAEPAMDVQFPFSTVIRDGKPYIQIMSMGPADESHPGMPEVQFKKLKSALSAGVRLMRGGAWLGLPSPVEIRDPALFVQTNDPGREQRQIDASARLKPAVSARLRLMPPAVGTRRPAHLTMKRCLPKHVLNGPMESLLPATSLTETIFCAPTIRRGQQASRFSILTTERGSKASLGSNLQP